MKTRLIIAFVILAILFVLITKCTEVERAPSIKENSKALTLDLKVPANNDNPDTSVALVGNQNRPADQALGYEASDKDESEIEESGESETSRLLREIEEDLTAIDAASDSNDPSSAPSKVESSSGTNNNIKVTVNKDEIVKRPTFNSGPPVPSAPTREDLNIQPSPTPESTPTPEPEIPFVSGPPRGYTMLYAMQPEARATVESELSILLDARLRNAQLGVLVDGTFGWDPIYLADIIKRLSEEGRKLTLVLYLSNGPTQRILDESPLTGNFPRSAPEDFRESIQFDPETRNAFRSLVRRSIPLFALNKRLNNGNQNIAVPMLEDNLDEESYRAIKSITDETLSGLAITVRNPCPGCYEGNDIARLGAPLELHGRENLPLLQRGDAFSLDGSGYILGTEVGTPASFTVPELQSLLQTFTAGGIRYFGLWRKERQGITDTALRKPSLREYALPSLQHVKTETSLLRFALPNE